MEVVGTGEETTLAGIMRLVEQAQASRSRAQALADRAAMMLTFMALGAGVLTVIAWLAIGASLEFTITRLVAVLVIACPHALGLAVPLVISISTTMGAATVCWVGNVVDSKKQERSTLLSSTRLAL